MGRFTEWMRAYRHQKLGTQMKTVVAKPRGHWSCQWQYQRPPMTQLRSVGHHKEWLLACRTGSPTRSNFDFAGPLTEAVLLGMVCVRHGGDTLHWDSANLKVTNDPDANRFLHYEYRPGWKL